MKDLRHCVVHRPTGNLQYIIWKHELVDGRWIVFYIEQFLGNFVKKEIMSSSKLLEWERIYL